MSKVVLDIETIGVDFEEMPLDDQKYLLKRAKDEAEKEEIKNQTALSPLTGEVVSIGMYNPETKKGMVLFQNKGEKIENFEENGILYQSGEEKEILQKFWDFISNFEMVITFNGRGFDIPYLMIRSAIFQIRSRKNLMGYRYDYKVHCDLLDQLTFYGATRRYSLDFYLKSFGIESSKKEGINGEMVGELYQEKKYLEVARYCARDLLATNELFDYWNKYLRF